MKNFSLIIILFACVTAMGQSQLLYRSFNPTTGTCTDAANVLIYQTNSSFTTGTYQCIGGVFQPVNLASSSGGTVTGSGTTGFIPKWTSANGLGDSLLSQVSSTNFRFGSSLNVFEFPGIPTISDTTFLLMSSDGSTPINLSLRNLRLNISSGNPQVQANGACFLTGIGVMNCPALTNGQVLLGSTGAIPQPGNITGTSPIVVTNGANSLALSCPSCITTGSNIEPTARVFNTTTLNLVNITPTVIAFDSERWDNDTIHDNVTNNTRLTAKTAGRYQITANIAMSGTTACDRELYIQLNGTTIIAREEKRYSSTSLLPAITITTLWDMSVNDYVEVFAQVSGCGTTTTTVNGNYSPEFMMIRVG